MDDLQQWAMKCAAIGLDPAGILRDAYRRHKRERNGHEETLDHRCDMLGCHRQAVIVFDGEHFCSACYNAIVAVRP